MKPLRLLAVLLLSLLAGLLSLALISLVWLGLAGAPTAAAIAERLLDGQLQVESVDGGLFGPVRLGGIRYENQAMRVELDRAEFDWRPSLLRVNELRISRLELGRLQLWLKPTPPSPAQPLSPALPVDLRLDAFSLATLELHTATAAADAEPLRLSEVSAALNWRGERIEIGQASVRHASIGQLSASGALRLAPQAIAFERLQITGPGVAVVEGRYGLMGTPSQLGIALRGLRWPPEGAARIEVPALTASLSGRLSGELDARLVLEGALRAAMPGAAAAPSPPAFSLDAVARIGSAAVLIERLQLLGPERDGRSSGSLRLQGRAAWSPVLAVTAEAELDQLDPSLLLPDFPGRLNGRISARSEGDAAAPTVRFEARLADSRLRDYPLALDAAGSAQSRDGLTRLDLDRFELRSGSARLSASGALLPALAAELALVAPDLQALLPELSGAARLKASLQGEPANPALRSEGRVQALRYRQLSLADGRYQIDYDPANRSSARIELAGLGSGEVQVQSLNLSADGRAEQHRITLAATLAEPHTEASLRLDGALDVTARRWQGQLSDSRLQAPYGPDWQQEAPAALSLEASGQSLAQVCWRLEASGRACLAGQHRPPLLAASTELSGVETAAFAALLPEGYRVETRLDGGGRVELRDGLPTRLDVELRLGAGRILLPQQEQALQLLPGRLAVRQDGPLWRASADLKLDQASLVGEASLPTQGGELGTRPLSGRLRLEVPDLAWLQPLLPGVSELAGRLSGDLGLAGTPAAPLLDGRLQLLDGQARIEAAGILVDQLRAEVRGGLGSVLSIEASARSGEGVLSIKGQADLAAHTAKLDITGDNLKAANLPDARVWVSPKLVFEQKPEGYSLTGEVLVPRAEITPRKLGGGIVSASGDQVIVGAEATEKPLPLNASVRLRMGEAVRFEGFGLKARIGGQLTVLESPGAGGTRARGELQLLDAVYKAYGQDLALETGRILFSGGPIAEPTVDFRAIRRPNEDVSVTLHVRGTLDKPTFDLSSSPAMTQEQQLGWLLLGRPLDAGGEFSAASAALSLGLAGGDQLTKKLTKGLGIDTISLGAEAGEDNEQARFTVGKYLSPKLYVSYGVGLFANGNVLRLLYDLGRGFKLRTESGQESGGDLLYTKER